MKSFSLNDLITHIDSLMKSGELTKAKGNNWKTASRSVIGGLSPAEINDLREVNLEKAISIYKAKRNPVKKTLAEYKGRVSSAIQSFLEGNKEIEELASKKKPRPTMGIISRDKARKHEKKVIPASNTLQVPLRPDFLAQLILPYDLKVSEAKRLCTLIQALPMETES